ncbi:PREDICTED: translocon-associated protein subunit delta [Nicrophorus vespilloides]|uniref:Translocon-associated protein subunit delta n=1 Tax=Nicrophorus vespilloides TaxID=110193 RepID=A0ABM1N2N5_NICVS|nr:PREDICTED: translocon-associated protein subunit delta [Nicrophorus vespilloides]
MNSNVFLFVAFVLGACSACKSPEVTSTQFTTQDGTIVANIAYITEFSIKCASGVVGNLYASFEGNVVPVSVVGENQYQVSWSEDNKVARSGEKVVKIYDEVSYTAIRKALRAGEDTSAIASFVDVSVHHPGAFNGPWLKSEFLAAVLSVGIAYVAVSSRSKLAA